MTDPHPTDTARAYAATLAMVAVSTLAGLFVAPRWGTAPVDMLFLPVVLAAAALFGRGAAFAAALLSALAYNYFFVAPIHSFRIDRPEDLVTVALLLLVAVVTSQLAARMREQARIAAANAQRNATIAGLARKLLSCSTPQAIGAVAAGEIAALFGCNACLLAPDGAAFDVLARVPGGNPLTPSDVAAAALTIETGEPAGRGAPRFDPADWLFYPVRGEAATIAAMGLARDDGASPVDPGHVALLVNLLDQAALALERARLEAEAAEFARVRERDRVRSALLSSIGQDLDPPLRAIAGAVARLKREGSADKAVLSEIAAETAKLDRYLSKLLDLDWKPDQQPVELGGVTIDLFQRTVRRDGTEVHLTPKEYAVLAELAMHRGRVLTHAHLLRAVWGPAQERQIDYLRVAIRAIRRKLERDPARPSLIVNEPAVGYRLAAA